MLFIYMLLYPNLMVMVTANQKSTIDAHSKKKRESKHNSKFSHKRTKEEGKKKDLQKQIQNN